MRGSIELTGLRARGHHGVYDFERRAGQEFVVDVRLLLDLAPAAASDDVADTVHYGDLARRLVEIVGGEPVNLLETLADRLLAVCLADARVDEATVTVHKPQAPIPHEFGDVCVTLTRGRAPATAATSATEAADATVESPPGAGTAAATAAVGGAGATEESARVAGATAQGSRA